MNGIDASDHYDISAFQGQTPSLLTVVIDTNPRAWAALKSVLPISKAIANILVFINAHLAFGNENQVAVLAAHTTRAAWLYPRPSSGGGGSETKKTTTESSSKSKTGAGGGSGSDGSSANKYPQFAQIESSILSSLNELINGTTPADVEPTTTLIAGALTLALAHINKTSLALAPTKTSSSGDPAANPVGADAASADANRPTLHARILVISASDSAAAQYIATMNAVFAASHARIPVDTLSLRGSPTFLQQAAYITGGNFLSAAPNPRALLSYLMFGFLADAPARRALVSPSQDTVDFRAACFCHRRVVDTGFVCSVCLSIFCEVPQQQSSSSQTPSQPQPQIQENGQPLPEGGSGSSVVECLTCGTPLALGQYGAKPAVVPRKKPKRKKNARANGTSVGPDTGSAAGTPVP